MLLSFNILCKKTHSFHPYYDLIMLDKNLAKKSLKPYVCIFFIIDIMYSIFINKVKLIK